MQQKQNCGHPLRRKGSIARVSKVTCGLLFCLTTGVFAAGENVELLTSDRIENAVPDQVGKTVTIMVQDEMGPVAGANVVVKGTTNGNISDMDGKVVLQNVPNNSTLVISFIGYTTQEVKVSNQATIHVKLVEDAKALEEVVVIGYGSLDKKQVTSAITSLKADDLMVGVSGADISASLQGKIGGEHPCHRKNPLGLGCRQPDHRRLGRTATGLRYRSPFHPRTYPGTDVHRRGRLDTDR